MGHVDEALEWYALGHVLTSVSNEMDPYNAGKPSPPFLNTKFEEK